MFLGSDVSFPGNASRWKLKHKIVEHESCGTEQEFKDTGHVSEGRAVVVASNVDSSFPEKEAIIMIRCSMAPPISLSPLCLV